MFKLLNAFVETPNQSPLQDDMNQKFTRFAPRHSRDPVPSAQDAPLSTDQSDTTPVTGVRPITRAGLGREPKFNDMAHLHTEARVCVSVLRRALPQRFAAQS